MLADSSRYDRHAPRLTGRYGFRANIFGKVMLLVEEFEPDPPFTFDMVGRNPADSPGPKTRWRDACAADLRILNLETM